VRPTHKPRSQRKKGSKKMNCPAASVGVSYLVSSRHSGLDPESSLPTRHSGLDPESSLPSRHSGLDPESRYLPSSLDFGGRNDG
jgi:hypothetical protein